MILFVLQNLKPLKRSSYPLNRMTKLSMRTNLITYVVMYIIERTE